MTNERFGIAFVLTCIIAALAIIVMETAIAVLALDAVSRGIP